MHVGLIPDGHRRWARQRGLSLQQAYAIGFANGIDIAVHLSDLGVCQLSVFALSTDNYRKRPAYELEEILNQLAAGMNTAAHQLQSARINMRIVGNVDQLSSQHRQILHGIVSVAPEIKNPRAEMNVLVNYDISWDFDRHFSSHATRDIGDCDLIFRSGGARRLSGFLPKQAAYSELFFSAKLWPDVTKSDLAEAISEVKAINRNFGA